MAMPTAPQVNRSRIAPPYIISAVLLFVLVILCYIIKRLYLNLKPNDTIPFPEISRSIRQPIDIIDVAKEKKICLANKGFVCGIIEPFLTQHRLCNLHVRKKTYNIMYI